jgi:hypothetical protein
MTLDTLEARWCIRASWARDQAARLHPCAPLQLVADDTSQLAAALERLRDERAQAFLEFATGTRQPSLAQAAGWLSIDLALELLPVVARAIWITQGCPPLPPNQLPRPATTAGAATT